MRMRSVIVTIVIIGSLITLMQSEKVWCQSANGTAGLFEVSNAEVVTPGTFGFNILGRKQNYSGIRHNQLAISLLLGMSKYIEFGANLSDALNLLADSMEHPRYGSLTMKTRLYHSDNYFPSLSASFTLWRAFSSIEETSPQADYGINFLLSEKMGRAKVHVNIGTILSELKNKEESKLLFGTGFEYTVSNYVTVFLEAASKTNPYDETDLLLARYNVGCYLRLWREVWLQSLVGYDRLNNRDGYTINIGLLAGVTAVKKVKPKRVVKRPKISSFTNLLSLDQALKSLNKDTTAKTELPPKPEEKPTRLMELPLPYDSLSHQADDSNILSGIRVQAIYNACGKPHLAMLLKEKLVSLGGAVEKTENADTFDNWQTTIVCHPDLLPAANRLADWLNISSVQIEESVTGDGLIINIGCDMVNLIHSFGYKVIQTPEGKRVVHPGEE